MIAAVLSLLDQESDQEFDTQGPLMEMGLDSLATTQLVQQLSAELGIKLSPTLLFDYPTVEELSGHLAGELGVEDLQDDDDSNVVSVCIYHWELIKISRSRLLGHSQKSKII